MIGTPWFAHHRGVRRFATILRAAGLLDDRYHDHPEQWDREHRIWVSLEEPEPPKNNITTLNWERFVARSRRPHDSPVTEKDRTG